MDLNILWFALITILFVGFFFLEGFDYGVGILLPFLGRTDRERRVVVNTIGPFWDANEVWLITAGGAMFAAFPHWYATMFSGYYLALVLMLLALIGRGVAFEFRSKDKSPRWRKTWDWAIFAGSALPALLWGVALTSLWQGVPIDASMNYAGNFWDLITPFTLLGGLTSLLVFTVHGALFLTLKASEPIVSRADKALKRVGPVTTVAVFVLFGYSYFATDILDQLGVNPGIIPFTAGAALLAAGWFIRQSRHGWAFIMTGVTIVATTVTIFLALYPRVMVSSLDADWSLTIYNASSSPYTLRTMSFVALIFVPLVLIYQGWSYYVFRQRVGEGEEALTY
jgi:cytochrome d ubiquinol oxidase subunit II